VDGPTGSYTAVLDADGELLVAVADMAAVDAIGTDQVRAAGDLLAAASLVVLDGNLSPQAMAAAARAARDRPLVLDPVSVPKAERARALVDGSLRWHLVTPDHLELAALTGMPATYERQVDAACAALHERGVTWVWVREGDRGSLLSGPDGATRLPAVPTRVVDVTGAGDAMLAAWCHGVLSGRTPLEAARLGHAAAALTIASEQTVRHDLTPALLETTSGGSA
jgi:pseudouridine kinase